MTDNVAKLHVANAASEDDIAGALNMIDEVRGRVASGELVAVYMAGLTRDDMVTTAWVHVVPISAVRCVGAVSWLLDDLKKRFFV